MPKGRYKIMREYMPRRRWRTAPAVPAAAIAAQAIPARISHVCGPLPSSARAGSDLGAGAGCDGPVVVTGTGRAASRAISPRRSWPGAGGACVIDAGGVSGVLAAQVLARRDGAREAGGRRGVAGALVGGARAGGGGSQQARGQRGGGEGTAGGAEGHGADSWDGVG